MIQGDRLGPYEIVAPLGAGGMGEVYRATDTRLKREVAIKVLPEALSGDRERLARFEREAQILAQLHHPSIASVFGLEESGGKRAIVMELVEGEDLAAHIARGPLPLAEALPLARQIADALEAAHEHGIVHRDLKPSNVKVRPDGTVKVLDFGLAKGTDLAARSSPDVVNSPTLTHATQLGVILGTVGYMSPEQARGKAVDRRADIWAFGAVLYEMLSGRRAFEGEEASDILAAVLRQEIDWAALPAGVPVRMRRLLERCLERDPKRRLRDIGEARLVLEDVLATPDEPARALLSSSPSRARALLPLAAAAGALGLALAAYALGRSGRNASPVAANRTGSGAPVAVRFQQITDSAGVESSPSLSPDGRDVAFTRIVDGRSEIMIQRVGARTSTPLTAGSGVDDRQPAFSPDGGRIAFRSERDGGGIFLMDTSGEAIRRISDFGFHPTWSPDGKELAVAANEFLFPTDRGGVVRGLSAIDVQTGKRRELSRSGDVMQPRWSPHGQRIAYWGLRESGGQRDLFTVAADGSEAEAVGREVTNDTALDWSPEWSPDGRFLYFASNRGGTMNLWRVPIDEASGAVLGAAEPVTVPSLWVGYLSFSRDGKRFAYASLDWRTTLYRAELDPAKGSLAGAPSPLFEGTQPIRDHQLSPDGSSIVFMRMAPQEDLFVARTDGSQLRRLTDDAFRDRGPSWSPDGQKISFYSDRSGRYQLWTIHPDGSSLVQMTSYSDRMVNFASWSPDGKRIAFSVIPGDGQVLDVSFGAASAKPEPLPAMGENRRFWPASWSRDGRRLAGIVVRDSGVIETVAIYDFAAGSYTMLPGDVSRQWRFPLWLSDSRRLVVRDGRGIWLVDPGRGEPHQLVKVGGYSTGVSVGISHDDRTLTWTQTGTEGDIWVASFE